MGARVVASMNSVGPVLFGVGMILAGLAVMIYAARIVDFNHRLYPWLYPKAALEIFVVFFRLMGILFASVGLTLLLRIVMAT